MSRENIFCALGGIMVENGPRGLLRAALLTSTALAGVNPAVAQNLPTGASVQSGGVAIATPSASQMTIRQSTNSAVVNWQGFSIGQGSRVDIQQPSSSSAILNRVTGSTRSTIAGQLNANGQVYLVNPNGIAITKSGTVNAGGFVASSLGTSDEDFKAGRRHFRGNGSSAPVSNAGAITVGRGGYAALLGGKVSNSGTISVPTGKVGLGAGERATLDLSGDGFLQVAVPSSGGGKGALIRHSGLIQAGRVEMKAATAHDAARRAINLSGTVEATSVGGRNGTIVLGGGAGGSVRVTGRLVAPSGRVRVTGRSVKVAGTIDASGASGGGITLRARKKTSVTGQLLATGSSGKGGTVKVLGETVALEKRALVDVSGATGGGKALVGGDYQGKNPNVPNAKQAFVGSQATVRADATQSGDGGKVIVWSNEATRFYGAITANGGPQGGDGGFAEVSGKENLTFMGSANLAAPSGRVGTLLLDPRDINVVPGGGTDDLQITIDNGVLFADGGSADFQIGNTALSTTLRSANTVLQATRDVTFNAAVTGDGGRDLLVQAGRTISVNAAVSTSAGGRISMIANNTASGETDAVGNGLAGSGATPDRGSGAGNLVINAAISSGSGAMKLVSSAASTNNGVPGDVTLNANVTTTGNVTIAANGGAITRTAGTLSGNLVTLSAANGIGSAGGADAIISDARSLNASHTISGNINVVEANSLDIVGISNTAGGNVSLITTNGSITTSGAITATSSGAITLTAGGAGSTLAISNPSAPARARSASPPSTA
jgi:filamentous hemagglutinin family protein